MGKSGQDILRAIISGNSSPQTMVILVAIYHMLKDDTSYRDLGVNHYDQINKEAAIKRSIKRIESLGYKVTLEPVAS